MTYEAVEAWVMANAWWMVGGSTVFVVLALLGTFIGLPMVFGRLPARYFVEEQPPMALWLRLVLNGVGWVLILLGISMLVLPGQGLLTIAAGLLLIDFPGKKRILLWALRWPPVRRSVDGIREYRGVEPLVWEE